MNNIKIYFIKQLKEIIIIINQLTKDLNENLNLVKLLKNLNKVIIINY